MRLCPRSLALASSILALGLERFCPRKGCPWPWPRIFFVCPWPWPWPRALCPRLHLCLAPCFLVGKLIFQNVATLRLGYDDKLTEDILKGGVNGLH